MRFILIYDMEQCVFGYAVIWARRLARLFTLPWVKVVVATLAEDFAAFWSELRDMSRGGAKRVRGTVHGECTCWSLANDVSFGWGPFDCSGRGRGKAKDVWDAWIGGVSGESSASDSAGLHSVLRMPLLLVTTSRSACSLSYST